VAATAATLVRHVGFVPQDAAVLLAASSVADELAAVDREAGVPTGTARGVLDGLVAGIGDDHHPNDLSEGQRLALALAVVLTPAPPVVLLDEPTRGLDYDGKRHLVAALRRLARDGHAVVLATHDVELVAELADRVVVLADGDVIADGPTSEVVRHSRVFAPQVARIMDPEPFLTVAEVARALELVP
jgi:energy-coupling factor transporter ATP-binding protein EcfA2